jgi:ADP-ribose pyrophosphatase YjhB (NUDIX family)
VDEVVSATAGVVVFDEQRRMLLVQRTDDGSWCLPGGRVDFGESVRDVARRECLEETGWSAELGELLGVYSDPRDQIHRYPRGETVQFVAVVFEARLVDHVQEPDDETAAMGWFEETALPEPLMASDAPIIRDAFSSEPRPIVR